MQKEISTNPFIQDVYEFFTEPNAYRSILILAVSMIVTYWLSNFLAKLIVRVAQAVANRSDNESNELKAIRLRQIETYLSVAIAVVRTLVVAIAGYLVWIMLSPVASSGVAAIGASTVFIVVAGQTIGILLRDLTAGSVMIIEKWFSVGDFVKLEPFWDIQGVVERFTLRSTRIRALNGEIITVHNQYITGVHLTPRGVRTTAVDVFVRDEEEGEKAIRELIAAIPKGRTMLAKPMKITSREKWGDNIWRLVVSGQTPPGREWLIEKFFIDALKAIDEGKKRSERLLVFEPYPRNADEAAERKVQRAIRVAREQEYHDRQEKQEKQGEKR